MITHKLSRGTVSSPRSSIKLEYLQNSILKAPCGDFLYDKVSLSGNTENVVKTLSKLSSVRNGSKPFTGEPVKVGMLRNLRVEVSKSGEVVIRGSLVTFTLDHNISQLSRKRYNKTIKTISKLLSVALGDFKVASYELALTIETKGRPFEYLRMLSDMRLKGGEALLPDIFKTSRSYKPQKHKELIYYDKSEQLKVTGRNLLRIEYRLKKQVGRKRGGVTLNQIFEPAFFLQAVATFNELFLSVGMNNQESEYDQKEIREAVKQAVKNAQKGL